jgi:hypothetical protein
MSMSAETRRRFIKKIIILGGMMASGGSLAAAAQRKKTANPICTLYRAINGSPEENIQKVIELAGGVGKLVGDSDVVLIKPNVQWWNQGAPNLSALKTFVELIMDRPGGFRGEVVLAENCHRGVAPAASKESGWAARFDRNADIAGVSNMGELAGLLKKRYEKRFSVVHWVDAARGGRRVIGPADGSGYVYCDGAGGVPLLSCDNGLEGNNRRVTIMTYPIFTTDQGTIVDFKRGIWEKGSYTGRPLRFINFSALNHHSAYCGITGSVKNYMGVTDLSGGPNPHKQGRLAGPYYNFHSFPFNEWSPGPAPGMLGKEIGSFIRTIRKADLNITTAEWVGLSSRTELPAARTRAVLACADPVALDYHGAKYIVQPNSKIPIHDPDNAVGALRSYLTKCAEEYGGILQEENVSVRSYDASKKNYQDDAELTVVGETIWGSEIKPLMKYFYLRYLNGNA